MLDANPQGRTRVIVQPPQAPQPPQPTPLAGPSPPPGSQDQLHALAAKRSELQAQLEALTDRREEIADQLHGAEAQARPGILARLQILDERIARLEAEVLQTDDAITAGLSAGLVMPPGEQTTLFEPPPPPEFPRFSEEAINIMAGEALAFVLLAIALYKLGWRRAKRKFAGGAPNETGRMDQLQNSVDAIALEIERISEGQRYVTKRLNEGTAGVEPISVGQEEAIPARRKAT